MVFVLRGFRISLFAGDGFSKLLAAGLTFGFALQTFIIVGGILRVIPLTGHHAAARLVRRLEHRRELPRARRADARLQPRERASSSGRAVNRQLNRLALVAIVLLAALVVATTYWQTWASAGPAGPAGQRDPARRAVHVARGLIEGADGKTIFATNDKQKRGGQTLYFRRYPQHGLAAQTVGYSTASRSQAGLERSMNDYLTGVEHEPERRVPARSSTGSAARPCTATTSQLTIRPQAQRLAQQLLGDRCGAVVAMNPHTGAVYVMASSPTYDPNLIDKPGGYAKVLKIRGACGGASALLQPRDAGPLHAGLDVQDRHRRGGARHGHVHAELDVRRPRLLHRVRQAGLERGQPRSGRARGVRPPELRDGVPALGQLGLLQHRQEARRAARSSTYAKKFGFYKTPPLETPANERAPSGLYNRTTHLFDPKDPTRRSTRAASRSARRRCS